MDNKVSTEIQVSLAENKTKLESFERKLDKLDDILESLKIISQVQVRHEEKIIAIMKNSDSLNRVIENIRSEVNSNKTITDKELDKFNKEISNLRLQVEENKKITANTSKVFWAAIVAMIGGAVKFIFFK